MIERLLIANRGEIACRILRTCRRLGIAAVTVFSEADRGALWVQQSDQAFLLGGAPASESYLVASKILEVARQSHCDAIHPGFGFLAENADFAQAVEDAGLTWVGPQPQAMRTLADKGAAKALAASLGIPVLQGFVIADQGPEEVRQQVLALGFPLMVKAAAGGGGKGMRLLTSVDDLEQALKSTQSEAQRSFGDARLVVERAALRARHIEVQIFGDHHGRRVHLGERDCSLQRRHQKIVEESPAADLEGTLCVKLYEAALRLAAAVDYRNAGTVEFLVAGDEYFFLEMNTRLQVEHPVTEEVTGLDLVEWQLRVAQGESLPWDEVERKGHSLEVRLYAEGADFFPSTGRVLLWRPPSEVRVECGLRSGDEIGPYYDPMVAKLISWGETRAQAWMKMRRALEQTVLLGVDCNRDFLASLLSSREPEVWTTATLPEYPKTVDSWHAAAAALAEWLAQEGDGWSNGVRLPHRLELDNQESVTLDAHRLEGRPYLAQWTAPELVLEWDGEVRRFQVLWQDDEVWVASTRALSRRKRRSRQQALGASGGLGWQQAPLSGSVLRLLVKPGERVEKGQTLLVLEAMKMEHRLESPATAQVSEVACQVGQVVQHRAPLLRLEEVTS